MFRHARNFLNIFEFNIKLLQRVSCLPIFLEMHLLQMLHSRKHYNLLRIVKVSCFFIKYVFLNPFLIIHINAIQMHSIQPFKFPALTFLNPTNEAVFEVCTRDIHLHIAYLYVLIQQRHSYLNDLNVFAMKFAVFGRKKQAEHFYPFFVDHIEPKVV